MDGKNSSSEVHDGSANRNEELQSAVAAAAASNGRRASPEEENEKRLDRSARDMVDGAALSRISSCS